MNIKKSIVAGLSLLAASTAVQAAGNVVYITGSTAFQKGANYGFTNTVPSIGLGYTYVAGDNADPTAATYALYSNSGGDYINCHWSGSEGGFQNVASTNPAEQLAAFLPSDATGFTYTSANATSTNRVDIAFADTDQSTGFFSGYGAKGNGNSANYPTLANVRQIGVIPFMFAATTNGSPGITNITSVQAAQLYKNGSVPMALWTGNLADTNKAIIALGRNVDSGTRMSLLAELGLKPAQRLKQFQITANNTGGLYPIETINNVRSLYLGNSGFSSSTGVKTALNYTIANASTIGCTQTGPAYSVGILGAGGNSTGYAGIAYNGVSYSAAGITNGSYGFWSYERLALSPGASTSASNTYNALITSITNARGATLPSGIFSLADMNVSKSQDGIAVSNSKY